MINRSSALVLDQIAAEKNRLRTREQEVAKTTELTRRNGANEDETEKT